MSTIPNVTIDSLNNNTLHSTWKCGDPLMFTFNLIYCIISGVCILFGLLYITVGYKFLRSTFFITGFLFMSLLIYLICVQVPRLPLFVPIVAPLGCGLLFGLICSLLFFIGFFITGYFFGFSIALYSLIVVDQFLILPSFWITIGLLFGVGTITAFISIKFTRIMSIISTSILGSCLIVIGLDYFVTMSMATLYIYDVMRTVSRGRPLCWIVLVVLCCPLVLITFSLVLQFMWTARGIIHKERYVPCLTAMKQVFCCLSGAETPSPKKYSVSLSKPPLRRCSRSDLDLVTERPLLRDNITNNNNNDTSSRFSTYLRGGTLTGTTTSSNSGTRTFSRASYYPEEGGCSVNTCNEADKFCHLYRIRQMRGDVPSESAKKSFQLRYSTHFDGESEA